MSAEKAVTDVINVYLEALRTNNGPQFLEAFTPDSTVTHAAVADRTVSTVSITEFIEQVKGFHAQFGTVVETPDKIQVDLSEPVAGVRVDFTIALGNDVTMTGTDFFSLAQVMGRWYITSKLYSM
ncbi:MAG TPA: nuclear transport factor 2 family protein [Sporichthyaceae bacterium]|nr:nuclear transport factor 2 family protein [Sporichthyaceae bacterium]